MSADEFWTELNEQFDRVHAASTEAARAASIPQGAHTEGPSTHERPSDATGLSTAIGGSTSANASVRAGQSTAYRDHGLHDEHFDPLANVHALDEQQVDETWDEWDGVFDDGADEPSTYQPQTYTHGDFGGPGSAGFDDAREQRQAIRNALQGAYYAPQTVQHHGYAEQYVYADPAQSVSGSMSASMGGMPRGGAGMNRKAMNQNSRVAPVRPELPKKGQAPLAPAALRARLIATPQERERAWALYYSPTDRRTKSKSHKFDVWYATMYKSKLCLEGDACRFRNRCVFWHDHDAAVAAGLP